MMPEDTLEFGARKPRRSMLWLTNAGQAWRPPGGVRVARWLAGAGTLALLIAQFLPWVSVTVIGSDQGGVGPSTLRIAPPFTYFLGWFLLLGLIGFTLASTGRVQRLALGGSIGLLAGLVIATVAAVRSASTMITENIPIELRSHQEVNSGVVFTGLSLVLLAASLTALVLPERTSPPAAPSDWSGEGTEAVMDLTVSASPRADR